MEKVQLEIFTSATCPHCPKALEIVNEVARERDDVVLVERNVSAPEHQEKAIQMQITSVPTLLVTGPSSDKPLGLRGIHSKEKINEVIDTSIKGEKKGFLKGLFSK